MGEENLDLTAALKIAREKYKSGDWIIPIDATEAFLIKGRIEIADHFYGICSQGMGAIWSRNCGWAKIVDKPLKSTIYNIK